MSRTEVNLRNSVEGSRALITGASSGIGAEFASQLAKLGCSLVLTARRRERLEENARRLRADHGVDVQVYATDLALPDAARDLKSALDQRGIQVDIIVNNAGSGLQADFVDGEWSSWEKIIDLDIRAFTQMSHVFARDMIDRGVNGYIVQVGSIFSFGGVPSYAVYSGAKSYVLSFSEALAEELRPHGISLTTLAPGVTQTEFFDTASGGQIPEEGRKFLQTPEQVVADGIRAMVAKKPVVISGWINKTMVFIRRLLPRQKVVRRMGKASRL